MPRPDPQKLYDIFNREGERYESRQPAILKILLVEDNPEDAERFKNLLNGLRADQVKMVRAKSLHEALLSLRRNHFDAVLVDLSLPDAEGLEGVTQIMAYSPGIPLLVLSDLEDDKLGLEAVQKGAQDFLVKGQGNGAILSRAIRYAIERKGAEERLAYLAQHDPLTGLANRILFRDRLLQALARSKRIEQPVGLMLLDLDSFKSVNDTLGHEYGDRLLKEAADRLRGCVREMDTVSRMGGDEFTILLEGIAFEQDLATVAQRILDSIALPFVFDGQEARVGISIGITIFPYDDHGMDVLVKHADMAMYQAKRIGGKTYQFYMTG